MKKLILFLILSVRIINSQQLENYTEKQTTIVTKDRIYNDGDIIVSPGEKILGAVFATKLEDIYESDHRYDDSLNCRQMIKKNYRKKFREPIISEFFSDLLFMVRIINNGNDTMFVDSVKVTEQLDVYNYLNIIPPKDTSFAMVIYQPNPYNLGDNIETIRVYSKDLYGKFLSIDINSHVYDNYNDLFYKENKGTANSGISFINLSFYKTSLIKYFNLGENFKNSFDEERKNYTSGIKYQMLSTAFQLPITFRYKEFFQKDSADVDTAFYNKTLKDQKIKKCYKKLRREYYERMYDAGVKPHPVRKYDFPKQRDSLKQLAKKVYPKYFDKEYDENFWTWVYTGYRIIDGGNICNPLIMHNPQPSNFYIESDKWGSRKTETIYEIMKPPYYGIISDNHEKYKRKKVEVNRNDGNIFAHTLMLYNDYDSLIFTKRFNDFQ